MKKELEPLIVTEYQNLWRDVVEKTGLCPGVLLPVRFVDSESNQTLGNFHASFVVENSKIYLQLENFDTNEWAEFFFNFFNNADWQIHPGGIYRLEL